MALMRDRPYGNFRFQVEIETAPEAEFAEVVLPEALVEVIEYRTGGEGDSSARKMPGRAHYQGVILKRGAIGSLDLYQWWDQVRRGDPAAFRYVHIHLLTEERQVALTWHLRRAWPVRYCFSKLEAQGKEPLLEMLELAYDSMEME